LYDLLSDKPSSRTAAYLTFSVRCRIALLDAAVDPFDTETDEVRMALDPALQPYIRPMRKMAVFLVIFGTLAPMPFLYMVPHTAARIIAVLQGRAVSSPIDFILLAIPPLAWFRALVMYVMGMAPLRHADALLRRGQPQKMLVTVRLAQTQDIEWRSWTAELRSLHALSAPPITVPLLNPPVQNCDGLEESCAVYTDDREHLIVIRTSRGVLIKDVV
jgi:hypothetical protein